MAKDKLFFNFLTYVHPKYKTPALAILIQAVWTCILILFWGTFEALIEYVVFMDWVFMTLAAISIFIFRKKLPNANRPYKTFGYPITPIIFIGISLWFIFQVVQLEHESKALIDNPILAAIVISALGLPIYFFFKFKNKKAE